MSDNKKYFEEFLQIWPKGALNAHKALCAAPISMGRGETPVEL